MCSACDIAVDVRMILKWILVKWGVPIRTKFVYFKVGTSGRPL
jgi:hypothetical protein